MENQLRCGTQQIDVNERKKNRCTDNDDSRNDYKWTSDNDKGTEDDM